MRLLVAVLLLTVSTGYAQPPESSNIDITGDAAINVAPDRVRTDLGVESRNKVLDTAIAQNDAIVRRVIGAARDFHIEEGDIQTDSIHVEMAYDSHDGTVVDYYQVTKSVQVFLRDVSKFEPLLTGVLRAGANHIYDVQFSTSELRKYRDQARALAVKAAIEKATTWPVRLGSKSPASQWGFPLTATEAAPGTAPAVAIATVRSGPRTSSRISAAAGESVRKERSPWERLRSPPA